MDVVESKWYEMDMPLNDVKKLLSVKIVKPFAISTQAMRFF